jgi:surface antigen
LKPNLKLQHVSWFFSVALTLFALQAQAFTSTVLTSKSSTSPYAREKNAFYATSNGQNLLGQCTWYAYGRVIELVEKGELGSQAGATLHAAFWNTSERHAKNWPSKIGGTWHCTSSQALPMEKRRAGLLAVWKFGTYGHVGFVEEVSADKSQYRLTDFNQEGDKIYRSTWLPFVGNDTLGLGVYPCFYELPLVTSTKPIAPASMSATALSSSSIKLTWSDNSNNETGFYVYRYGSTGWSRIATRGANTTSYTNSGLSANTAYYYTVASYNSVGESWYSSYVSAATPAATTTNTVTSYQNNSTVSGSVASKQWKYYTVTSSSANTQLKVELYGLSADLDLYVKKGYQPTTTSSYNCRSIFGGTNAETCTLANSGVNTWYIGVYGYAAGSYTLKVTLR